MSFTDKVVIVTGASSGIGATTAIKFAEEGAEVVVIGRNEKKLEKVTQDIKKVGKQALVLKADISKDSEAQRIIDATLARFKKIDILVNNAGFSKNGSVLSGDCLEAYDQIFATNVRALINLSSLVAPHLVKTKGNIVNISSILGTVATGGNMICYSTSKAAIDHFSRGAALELAEFGVRVNTVSPGPVVTDFSENSELNINIAAITTPLKRVSTSEEVADLIMFVASDKAIGITGSTFVVDNGARFGWNAK